MNDSNRIQRTDEAYSKSQREIVSWAYSSLYTPENKIAYERLTGDLPENVTEIRLLHKNLMNLSKQRLKALQEFGLRKNNFIDSQKIKSKYMKDLLSKIDINQYRDKDNDAVEIYRQKSFEIKKKIIRERFGGEIPKQYLRKSFSSRLMTSYSDMRVSSAGLPILPKSANKAIHSARTCRTMDNRYWSQVANDKRHKELMDLLSPVCLQFRKALDVCEIVESIDSLAPLTDQKLSTEDTKSGFS